MNYSNTSKLENAYLIKRRRNTQVILDDIDFVWDEDELVQLLKMYKQNKTLTEMNEVFQRKDPDEIFLALFHLARQKKIKSINLWGLTNGFKEII